MPPARITAVGPNCEGVKPVEQWGTSPAVTLVEGLVGLSDETVAGVDVGRKVAHVVIDQRAKHDGADKR